MDTVVNLALPLPRIELPRTLALHTGPSHPIPPAPSHRSAPSVRVGRCSHIHSRWPSTGGVARPAIARITLRRPTLPVRKHMPLSPTPSPPRTHARLLPSVIASTRRARAPATAPSPSPPLGIPGVLVRPYQGPIIPEAMGAIGGTAYLVSMFCFIPFAFYDIGSAGLAAPPAAGAAPARSIWRGLDAGSGMAGPSADGFLLSKYLCGLLAICCMCFLGFADNVLDLRWRDKLWCAKQRGPDGPKLVLLRTWRRVSAYHTGHTSVWLPRIRVAVVVLLIPQWDSGRGLVWVRLGRGELHGSARFQPRPSVLWH